MMHHDGSFIHWKRKIYDDDVCDDDICDNDVTMRPFFNFYLLFNIPIQPIRIQKKQ